MATIVQKPKIFDSLEIQSDVSRSICCWLEIVEFKMLYFIPQLQSVIHGMRLATGGLEAGFIRCPTPNSVAQRTPYWEFTSSFPNPE